MKKAIVINIKCRPDKDNITKISNEIKKEFEGTDTKPIIIFGDDVEIYSSYLLEYKRDQKLNELLK